MNVHYISIIIPLIKMTSNTYYTIPIFNESNIYVSDAINGKWTPRNGIYYNYDIEMNRINVYINNKHLVIPINEEDIFISGGWYFPKTNTMNPDEYVLKISHHFLRLYKLLMTLRIKYWLLKLKKNIIKYGFKV